MTMAPDGRYISINWLTGLLLLVVVAGGSAWLSYVQNQITMIGAQQATVLAKLAGLEMKVDMLQRAVERGGGR